MNANHTVDLLIVGSGNGALTAALCAYEFGVRDVLVVEKTAQYGGTSATSGGGIWIPCNRYAREAGAEDSLDAAREYLRATIPAGLVPPALLETYVVQGPRMLLADSEDTDARPSIVTQHEERYISVFSGKVDHSVWVAEEISSRLGCLRRSQADMQGPGINATETVETMFRA